VDRGRQNVRYIICNITAKYRPSCRHEDRTITYFVFTKLRHLVSEDFLRFRSGSFLLIVLLTS
jgi:hypothetical protein